MLTPASVSNVDLLVRRGIEQEGKQQLENVATPVSLSILELPTTSHTTTESPAVGIENAMQYVSKIKVY